MYIAKLKKVLLKSLYCNLSHILLMWIYDTFFNFFILLRRYTGKCFLTWTCHTEENIILPDTCQRRLMKLLNCLNYFHNLLRGCMMYNVQTKIWVIHFWVSWHIELLIFKFVHVATEGVFPFIFFLFLLSSLLIPSSAHKSIKGNVMTYHMYIFYRHRIISYNWKFLVTYYISSLSNIYYHIVSDTIS